MSLQATVELGRKKRKQWFGVREYVHSVHYRLSPKPFRLLNRWELPKRHQLEGS